MQSGTDQWLVGILGRSCPQSERWTIGPVTWASLCHRESSRAYSMVAHRASRGPFGRPWPSPLGTSLPGSPPWHSWTRRPEEIPGCPLPRRPRAVPCQDVPGLSPPHTSLAAPGCPLPGRPRVVPCCPWFALAQTSPVPASCLCLDVPCSQLPILHSGNVYGVACTRATYACTAWVHSCSSIAVAVVRARLRCCAPSSPASSSMRPSSMRGTFSTPWSF